MNVTREIWWNVPGWMALGLYLASAAGLAVTAWALHRVLPLRRARPAAGSRPAYGAWADAVRRAVVEVLGQRRVRRDAGAGWAHLLLVYGFGGLFIGTCLVFVHDTLVPFLVGPTYLAVSFALEWAGLLYLAGVGWLALRRGAGRTPRLERSAEAWAVLALLGAIGATGFALEGARIAATDPPFEVWSFVGWTLARGIRLAALDAPRLHRILWGAHAALSAAFFALLGATLLRHLLLGPVQLLVRGVRPVGAVTPDPPEPGSLIPERWTRAQLLEAATCVRCGRCAAACPATAAGKPLDPRAVVQAALRAVREGVGLERFVARPAVWSCTTCAACVAACPFEIEVLDKLVDLRRHLVEAGEADRAAAAVFEGILERGNAWSAAPVDRARWAEGLGVRVLAPGEATRVLYWVGCAAAFEPGARRAARATVRLLQQAGVEFAILGAAEPCTGDPARRLGEEGCFREAAARVAATLDAVRFERLLTHCPHCYHVFRAEYPALGHRYPVVHHTQLLAELVAGGRLRPLRAPARAVTFHDPCYLARHHGETAAPRALLGAFPGLRLAEMRRHARETFCCGAGGGGYWVEVRGGRRVAAVRMDEARETAADVVATACPFCTVMLEGEVSGTSARVRDVAELLWEACEPPAWDGSGSPPAP